MFSLPLRDDEHLRGLKHLDHPCANCRCCASAPGAGGLFIQTGLRRAGASRQEGRLLPVLEEGRSGLPDPWDQGQGAQRAHLGLPGKTAAPRQMATTFLLGGPELHLAKLPTGTGTVSRPATLKPPSLPSDPRPLPQKAAPSSSHCLALAPAFLGQCP